MLAKPIEWLASGVLPKSQLCNVTYDDFIQSPLTVAETIYHQFGIELTPEGRKAMQDYMDRFPRSSRPRHSYQVTENAELSTERQAFAKYQNYFKVPSEV
jgi:hypothetical protein